MKTNLLVLVMMVMVALRGNVAMAGPAVSIPEDISVTLNSRGVELHLTLKNPDSNGVFTGKVALPESFDTFTVDVSSRKGDGSVTSWGVMSSHKTPFIYSDYPYEVNLLPEVDSESNLINVEIHIIGEKPGEMVVSVDWNEFVGGVHSPRLILECDNEPAFGHNPECMYLIGDFNGYRLPDEHDLNGAVEMTKGEGANLLKYDCNLNVEGISSVDMIIYCPEIRFVKNVFYGFYQSFPFTLFKYNADKDAILSNDIAFISAINDGIPDIEHIRLHELRSKSLHVTINLEQPSMIYIETSDAELLEIPSTASMMVNNVISNESFNHYSTYFEFSGECETWLSETGDTTFDPATSWGSPSDKVIDITDYHLEMNGTRKIPAVKGGYPFKFTSGNDEQMTLSVSVNPYNGYAAVSGCGHSAVDETEVEDIDAREEYYTLDGIKVSSPSNGIYIVKRGLKVYKVIKR